MCHSVPWFGGQGGVGSSVGLGDLGDLFQPNGFCDLPSSLCSARLPPALPGNRKSLKGVSLQGAELLAAIPHRGPAAALSVSRSFRCSRNSRSPREAGRGRWGGQGPTAGAGQGCAAPQFPHGHPQPFYPLSPPTQLPVLPKASPQLCREEQESGSCFWIESQDESRSGLG